MGFAWECTVHEQLVLVYISVCQTETTLPANKSHIIFVSPFQRKVKLNVGYNFAISKYFFIKLLIYTAYDNMDTMMSNSLGQSHICWSFAPFC